MAKESESPPRWLKFILVLVVLATIAYVTLGR